MGQNPSARREPIEEPGQQRCGDIDRQEREHDRGIGEDCIDPIVGERIVLNDLDPVSQPRLLDVGAGGGGKPHHGWRQKGTWSIAAFVGDGEGHELVDEVIRLEDAAARLPVLGNELHLPGQDALRLPHVNVHRHAKYTAYYDDETAEHVARLYAEDIARFDYRFGS